MPERSRPNHPLRRPDSDVTKILQGRAGRRWYDNSPPHWSEGRNKRRCKSAAIASAERQKAIKTLRKHGVGNLEAKEVRKALEACTPKQRCLSGACPECTRALQRWFVESADRLLRRHRAGRFGF